MSSQFQFLSKCFLKKISTNFEICDQFKPREKRQNSIDGAKRKKRAFKKIRFWLDATAAAVSAILFHLISLIATKIFVICEIIFIR